MQREADVTENGAEGGEVDYQTEQFGVVPNKGTGLQQHGVANELGWQVLTVTLHWLKLQNQEDGKTELRHQMKHDSN